MVLTEIQIVEDVGVPWLKIDSECTRALVATLIDVTSCRVVRTEHRYDTVGVSVGSRDVRTREGVNQLVLGLAS